MSANESQGKGEQRPHLASKEKAAVMPRECPIKAKAVEEIIRKQCDGKLWFDSESGAIRMGQKIADKHQRDHFVYQCDLCCGWHLSTKAIMRKDSLCPRPSATIFPKKATA